MLRRLWDWIRGSEFSDAWHRDQTRRDGSAGWADGPRWHLEHSRAEADRRKELRRRLAILRGDLR